MVADDLFASGLGDEVGLTQEFGEGFAEGLPEEDAAGPDHLRAREAGVSKMGGASGKKQPYQRLELRPSRMWMAVSRRVFGGVRGGWR